MAAVNTIAVQKKVSLNELVERVSQVISPETVAEELLGIITQDDNKNAKMRGIECYTRLVIKQDEVDRQLEEDDTDPELLRARIENFIAKNGIKSPQELIETIRGKDTGTTESDPTE